MDEVEMGGYIRVEIVGLSCVRDVSPGSLVRGFRFWCC